ncbi:hypothetical protein IAQ61_006517 [Plenodomus lingam]|uniref:uncharacterized protein n=1 Tax=Leptosphaeria maculans TaxID=5022 RepID=UPI003316754C|nr:hypothetical protein IAQ61_006517 [Plenodomus lingam]
MKLFATLPGFILFGFFTATGVSAQSAKCQEPSIPWPYGYCEFRGANGDLVGGYRCSSEHPCRSPGTSCSQAPGQDSICDLNA